ncbi:MAG: hypothetical protein AAGG68_24790 [Bacteroidota bacterium]
MKNMMSNILVLLLVLGANACKVADIRTSNLKQQESTSEKGRNVLEASIKAMGYDHLNNYKTYSAKSVFEWKPFWSMMPMNALPGNKNKEIEFHFSTNSFDGRVNYFKGRKKGDYHGIQSWQTYQSVDGKPLKFQKDKRRSWGLASYHYMIEAPNRLLNAPIIKYGGTTNMYGKAYDLVFATWGTVEANKKYDQWLLYINKETKFIDLAQLTIRDFFLPFPPNLSHGTVQYLSRKEVNEVHLPTEVAIQMFAPKKQEKYAYKFKLYDYKFDSLHIDELYPNPKLERLGDSKISK